MSLKIQIKEEWYVFTVWINKRRYTIDKENLYIFSLLILLLILIEINIIIW
jgi:hypothetical protein